MCNGPTYRYSLEVDGVFTTVAPIVADGVKRVVKKADDGEYYRTTLDGSLDFVRADYELIVGTSIEEQINFNMEKWDGTEWQTYFSGYFTKADCRFSVDECGGGLCTVSIKPRDFYDAILGGMDKEFDLIELEPEKTGFNFTRQPIFQVYALGDSVLTCYLGGTYFELDVPTPVTDTADMFSAYFFGYIGTHLAVFGEGLDPDVSGEYINDVTLASLSASPSYVRKSDGAYKIRLTGGAQWEIYDPTSGVVYYRSAVSAALFEDELPSLLDSTPAYVRGKNMFARFITNQVAVGVTPTSAIPASDIVSNPAAYERVLAIGLTDSVVPAGTDWEGVIIASSGHSTSPTRYGKYSDDAPEYAGEYFTIPAGVGSGAIYPQGQSAWIGASFWFQYDATLRGFQESGAALVQIADAYKFADALSAVIQELNPAVGHLESAAYSDFLYGASNAIRGTLRYPIITPKSNITVGQYSQPAKKGPIRLSELLQLARVAWNCFWYIDTSGKFILEHISFFDNGGTYSGTEVSEDLTTLLDPQTGKNWEWGANVWEYDVDAMPERIESGWMDRTTREFDGYPINIRSIYVQAGNIESRKATRFTADVDYMQLQPEDIAKEGFAVVECSVSKGIYTVPYLEVALPDGSEFKLQNGYLAFIYLHPNYHRYGLPASLIRMNEEDTTALSVTRRLIQSLEYPLISVTDYLALVTTGKGSGKVLEFREDVNGQYVEARIAHNTA